MPEPLSLLASLLLEDRRSWGEAAADFQFADAEAVLDPSGPKLHYQTRARGASKTSDAAAMAVASLVADLPPRSRSFGFAVDQQQAALLLDAAAGFVERTEGLGIAVESQRLVNSRTGATFTIMSADGPSAWGLLPHLVVVDEFSAWPETSNSGQLWRAIFSALPKVDGSRLLLLSTAGDPSHFSYDLLERARKSQRWRVSETPGPCPWISAEDLDEQRAELPDWEYERLHLNRWRAAQDRLSFDDLAACVVLDGPQDYDPARRYQMSIDIGLKDDATVLSVCSTPPGSASLVRLDRMLVWQGTRRDPVSLDVVESAILEAWRQYGKPELVGDPWQGHMLFGRLKAKGMRVKEYPFTQQSVSRIALRLHQLVTDRALQLPDDEALLEELRHVRVRETSPGVYRIDHDHGRHDDRAISLALAASALVERGGSSPARIFSARGRYLLPGTKRERTFFA